MESDEKIEIIKQVLDHLKKLGVYLKSEEREAISTLLEYYESEVTIHEECIIAMFFGLIGSLVIMTILDTFLSKLIFSFIYFSLGGLAIYYYIVLFYFGKMRDETLRHATLKPHYIEIHRRILKKSRIFRIITRFFIEKEVEYRLTWGWVIGAFASVLGLLAWAIVFFSM